MSGEDMTERVTDGCELRIIERARLELRGVTGRQQQPVAVSQGDLEALGEVEHHVGARLRAAGLDEAEMPRRDPCLEREVELAQPTTLTPVPQHDSHPILSHSQ